MTKRGFITLGAASTHVNKHPFSGVMTWFNAASDNPVGGANGKLVYIPADVGVPALDTLVGMGVNVRKSDLSGHNPQYKIGVIEKAWAGDPDETGAVPVNIEGYFYAKDFPDEVDDLRAEKDDIGFSYECEAKVEDMPDQAQPTVKVTSVVFTGAAALYKKKAAYTNTSLAAESEDEMNEEQLKQMLEAMGMDFGSLEDMLKWFKAMKEVMRAGGIYSDLSLYISAAADNAAKVSELSEKVASLEGELAKANEALTAQGSQLSASTGVEYVAKSDYDTLKASYDDLSARFTKVETDLAAEAAGKALYERKSVPVTLTAKYGVSDELDLSAAVEMINKSKSLDTATKFALITELREKQMKAPK